MRSKWFLPLCLLAVLTGCQNSKKPTQKELATAQWNATRANVLHGLANDQYSTGNFDKSRSTVNDALKLAPDNARLRILSAKLAIEQGQLELAEKELARARECDPTNAEADYLSGVVYQRWQKPETAFEFYSAAYEKAPAELAYLMARAEMLVAMDRHPEALELLEDKVIYFEHSAVIRDAVGQLMVGAGRFKEGASMLREASILAIDDLSIREHLGLALFYNKQYREAGEELKKLIANPLFENRSDLILALGECRMQMSKYREARDNFELAAQLDPSSAGAWLSFAKAAMQLNDLKRAELSLKKSMSIDPARSETHLMVGYLRIRQERYQDAMTSFQKASALDTTDTVSLCMVGYSLEKMGKSGEAMSYYSAALRMKPKDELAIKLMASIDVNE